MSRIGQGTIEGLQELADYSEGKIDMRTSRLNVSPVCEILSTEEIKGTREKLGMSQGIFAMVMGVSAKTVQSWETGRYMPDAVRRLISILQADPSIPEKYDIIRK